MPTVRQRYGRTEGRLTIAIPHFALRASRGKKWIMMSVMQLLKIFVQHVVICLRQTIDS